MFLSLTSCSVQFQAPSGGVRSKEEDANNIFDVILFFARRAVSSFIFDITTIIFLDKYQLYMSFMFSFFKIINKYNMPSFHHKN